MIAKLLLCSALFASPDVEPSVEALKARVQTELVAPLARKESAQNKFSRMARPTPERRVVVSAHAMKDSGGRRFFRFGVDERRGAEWTNGVFTGCVYEDGPIFAQRGGTLRAVAAYLGKKAEAPPARACLAADDMGA